LSLSAAPAQSPLGWEFEMSSCGEFRKSVDTSGHKGCDSLRSPHARRYCELNGTARLGAYHSWPDHRRTPVMRRAALLSSAQRMERICPGRTASRNVTGCNSDQANDERTRDHGREVVQLNAV
jgi:hypothetical protein